ncbi:hypothetical protein NU219Hw_g2438t1 [Hortaea werneckii]
MSAAATTASGGRGRGRRGEEEEEYWLLKSTTSQAFRLAPPASAVAAAVAAGRRPPRGPKVCIIELEPCSRRVFRDSLRFHRKYVELRAHRFMDERIHGRRCGDEVELFAFGEDVEETPGLRKALKAKGLTIRTFPSTVSSSSSSSSASSASSSTTTTTEGPASPAGRPVASSPASRNRDPAVPAAPVPVPANAAEKSFAKNCAAKIHSAVVAYELATHEPTPYALLADAQGPGRKGRRVVGVIVDEAEFQAVCSAHGKGEGMGKVVEANGVFYPLLGVYAKGSTIWWKGGEELRGFFGGAGKGEGDAEVVWFSRVKGEVERARREKRREKKERRREMVAAASASGSAAPAVEEGTREGSGEVEKPTEKPGDEEAQLRAQAKKDKEKARKKAYQARRRQNKKRAVKVPEFGKTAATTASTSSVGPHHDSDDDDEEEDSDDDEATTKKTHLRGAALHAILQVLTQRERAAHPSGSSRQRLTIARRRTPTLTTLTRRPRIIEPDTTSSSSSSSDSNAEDEDEDDEEGGEGSSQTARIVRVSSIAEGQEAIRRAAAAGSNVMVAAMEDVDVLFGRGRN